MGIPYYTGTTNYTYTVQTDTQNISFSEQPAHGQVQIFNITAQSFSLRPNTKLVTSDGLSFLIPDSITIPAATSAGQGQITVNVIAADIDEGGDNM